MISDNVEWTCFCELWRLIGTFFAIRDAKPEDRNAPEVLAALVVNTQAQLTAVAVTVMRLVDACDLLDADVERIERRLTR